MLGLNLPAGSYLVFGKAEVFIDGEEFATCRVYAGTSVDEETVQASTSLVQGSVSLMALGSSGSPFTAHLACTDAGSNSDLAWLKLTAIRLNGIASNTSG